MRAIRPLVLVLCLLGLWLALCPLAQAVQDEGAPFQVVAEAVAEPPATTPAAPAPMKEIPDRPSEARRQEQKIVISVEHEGSDNVGGRLAYHLKELFERSSLFTLSTRDERKLKVILRTVEEFPGRPNMSSAYALVLVYSETEGTLKYLLHSEVGMVHSASVKEDAELLAGKAHEIYSKYAYLFE